jgi:hypothetical protein
MPWEGKPLHRLAPALALLAATIGCGKGSGTPSTTTLPLPPGAPTGLVIEHLGFGSYVARWTPPAGPIDGYQLQARINGGAFEDASGPPIDRQATDQRLLASTPDEIHELDLVEVRLRALLGKLASDWSNVTGLREIVLPGEVHASVSLAPRPNDPGSMNVAPIFVTIEKYSVVATELKLERTEVPGSGGSVSWSRLPPVDPAVTTYSDAAVLDGTAYRYRVSFGAQGVWSETSEVETSALDVFAPAGLTASILPSTNGHPDGVHLQWTNRSATANAIAVSTLQLGPASGVAKSVATLAATASAMDDLGAWPFWPVQAYRVVAQRTGYIATPGFSDIALLPPYVVSGPVTLDARTLSVPQADQYLLDGAGRVHASVRGSPPKLFRPQGNGWESHDLLGVLFMLRPGVALDAADHPHVVYQTDDPVNAVRLRHEWHDGTSWISEEVDLENTASALAFAADPAGRAHVLFTTGILGTGDVVHLSNESGSWVRTTLPDVPAASNPTRSLHVAPDGTVYVSIVGFRGTALGLLTRGTDGTWSAEQIPGVDAPQTAWFFPADRAHAAFAFERLTASPINEELWYVAQTATGWAAPELIARRPIDGNNVAGSVAVGADGSRPFLVVGLPDPSGKPGCELFTRGEAWSEMTVGPGCGGNVAPRLGTDGKLRIAVGLGILGSSGGIPFLTEQ